MKIFNSKLHILLFIVFFAVTVLIAAKIFKFSSEPATVSKKTSNSFIYKTAELFNGNFSEISVEDREVIVEKYSTIVRKLAHFSIYASLGFFAFLSARCIKKPDSNKLKVLSVGLFTFLYSVSDEIHQLFVAGRSCGAVDVIIDFSGSLFGIAAALLVALIVSHKILHIERNTY